jgi:hypothetical protein
MAEMPLVLHGFQTRLLTPRDSAIEQKIGADLAGLFLWLDRYSGRS